MSDCQSDTGRPGSTGNASINWGHEMLSYSDIMARERTIAYLDSNTNSDEETEQALLEPASESTSTSEGITNSVGEETQSTVTTTTTFEPTELASVSINTEGILEDDELDLTIRNLSLLDEPSVDSSETDGGKTEPCPVVTDSLEVISQKMQAIVEVLKRHRWVAKHTDFKHCKYATLDPEAIAKSNMSPMELKWYTWWKDGGRLPPHDWDALPLHLQSAKSRQKHQLRALALREIWNEPDVIAENAAAFTANPGLPMYLITAVERVHKARRDLVSGSRGVSAEEMAEIQTLKHVLGVVMTRLNVKTSNPVANDIRISVAVVQQHLGRLKLKMNGADLPFDSTTTTTTAAASTTESPFSSARFGLDMRSGNIDRAVLRPGVPHSVSSATSSTLDGSVPTLSSEPPHDLSLDLDLDVDC